MLPKRPSNTILLHTYKSFPFFHITENHLCFANCIEVRTENSIDFMKLDSHFMLFLVLFLRNKLLFYEIKYKLAFHNAFRWVNRNIRHMRDNCLNNLFVLFKLHYMIQQCNLFGHVDINNLISLKCAVLVEDVSTTFYPCLILFN